SATGFASLRRCAGARRSPRLLLPREAHGLAAERIVLAQRVAGPVVFHDDPAQVGMAVEADAHEVEGLTLVPVRGRPHPNDARNVLTILDPALHAHPWGARPKRQ